MEMRRSDSSGTDDDLPPSSSQQQARGNRFAGNGSAKPMAITSVHAREQLVRQLEVEAYTAVLRAFGAQSEVITWDKERLISELRKELRVTDEQHRDFLAKVHRDDPLLKDLNKSGEGTSTEPLKKEVLIPHSVKRKKHATPAAMPPPPPPPLPAVKPASASLPSTAAKKSVQRVNKTKGASHAGRKRKDGFPDMQESLVGQTIKLRWEDGKLYEAFVKEFHPDSRVHTIVYDRGTDKETSEQVDLAKMSQDDLQLPGDWKSKKMVRNPSSEKLHSSTKRKHVPPERTPPAPQKWAKIDRKGSGVRHVILPSLDCLTKQVEGLDNESDLNKVEHTKRMAKEHEGLLRKVLVEIGESSDEGESDDRGRHRNGYRLNHEDNNHRRGGSA